MNTRTCPDCAVPPGETHVPGCDVERCPACKGQALSCGCGWDGNDPEPEPWSGIWPGKVEAAALGWFSVMTDEGWCTCKADHPEASPDLNRYSTYQSTGEDPGPDLHTLDGWEPTAIDYATLFRLQDEGRYYPGGKHTLSDTPRPPREE